MAYTVVVTQSQDWSKPDIGDGELHPVRRADHSAVCLGYGSKTPHLFVTGGRGNEILSDAWMLDITSKEWKMVYNFFKSDITSLVYTFFKVDIPGFQERYLHSCAAFTLSPGLTDVIIFGGCQVQPNAQDMDKNYPGILGTVLLEFGELKFMIIMPILIKLILDLKLSANSFCRSVQQMLHYY